MKALTIYPIAVALATSGCHKEVPKEPIITSEYEMNCENVQQSFIQSIYRCENKETICYTTTKGIYCLQKGNSK